MYGQQIEDFIRAHINHITKVEFFIAFKAAYLKSMTVQNAKVGFCGAGLVSFDPQAVISKLDIKLRTPPLATQASVDIDPWVSQAPHNPTGARLQTTLVKSRIGGHQESSPTPIFSTVAALAKGTEILAHEVTLLTAENSTLRRADEELSKRRTAQKTRVHQGSALTVNDAHNILAQKEVEEQIHCDKQSEEGRRNKRQSAIRHCGLCVERLVIMRELVKKIQKSWICQTLRVVVILTNIVCYEDLIVF